MKTPFSLEKYQRLFYLSCQDWSVDISIGQQNVTAKLMDKWFSDWIALQIQVVGQLVTVLNALVVSNTDLYLV